MVLAQTLLNALQTKVTKVEELLESLQDEVWEAEEEQEEAEKNKHSSEDDNNDNKSQFSLLDQVLAMILGALPMEPGVDKETHYKYIKMEHDFIVEGWKSYFGDGCLALRNEATATSSGATASDEDEMEEEEEEEEESTGLTSRSHVCHPPPIWRDVTSL